jgi:hypothetical protein
MRMLSIAGARQALNDEVYPVRGNSFRRVPSALGAKSGGGGLAGSLTKENAH